MSCKLKYTTGWSQLPTRNTNKLPHQNTILVTHRPTLAGRALSLSRFHQCTQPALQQDLGTQNRVHLQIKFMCHKNPVTRKGLEREKSESTCFLGPAIDSCSNSHPKVGALETSQHMTVLHKDTLNLKYIYIYIQALQPELSPTQTLIHVPLEWDGEENHTRKPVG